MVKDTPNQTTFENVISFFEKPASLGKKAFIETAGLKTGQDVSVESILRGTKSISSDDIRVELANKMHLPDLPDGTIGSVAKFATNFAIDAALDPLSYIPAFGIIKKFIKSGPNLAPLLSSTVSQKAVRFGAVGAVAGLLGTRFDENTTRNTLKNVGTGIATGLLASTLSKGKAGLFGKIGNELYDAYGKSTLGEEYFNLAKVKIKGIINEITPSKAFKIRLEHNKRVSGARDAFLRIRTAFIEDIKKPDNKNLIKNFIDVRNKGLNSTISLRNKYIDTELKRINKLVPKGSRAVTRLSQSELNNITAAVNTEVGREIDAVLKASGDKELTGFVKKYIRDNRRIIKGYNAHMLSKGKNNFTSIIPLDFHGSDILAPDAIGDIYKLNKTSNLEGFGLLSKSKFGAKGAITLEQEAALGTQRFTDALATRIEKRAIEIDRTIKNTGLIGVFGKDTGKTMNNALSAYDEYSSLWKSTVLGASVSWIKNNLFENTIRSIMVLGPLKGLETSLNQLPVSKIFRRLYSMADPVNGFKHLRNSDELLMLSKKVGVIDTNFFDDLLKRTGKDNKIVRLRRMLDNATSKVDKSLIEGIDIGRFKDLENDYVKKVIATSSKKFDQKNISLLNNIAEIRHELDLAVNSETLLKKTSEGWQSLIRNTSGRIGGTVENGARVGFFDEIVKSELNKLPKLKKTVGSNFNSSYNIPEFKKIVNYAAKLTDETFFDYKNVTAFEQKVMKRVIPFYGFYSKNITLWANLLENGGKEIAETVRAIRATGRQPTEKERKGIPDWVLDSFYRVSNDGKEIIRIPNISLADVLDNFSWRSVGTKLNPLIKTVLEQTSNKEFGLDQPVRPSGSKFGSKRLFARGLFLEGLPETGRDRKGNLSTTSDIVGTIGNIRGNLLPFPILDQVLGTIDNVNNKNKDLEVELSNKLSPVRRRKISEVRLNTLKRRRSIRRLRTLSKLRNR